MLECKQEQSKARTVTPTSAAVKGVVECPAALALVLFLALYSIFSTIFLLRNNNRVALIQAEVHSSHPKLRPFCAVRRCATIARMVAR